MIIKQFHFTTPWCTQTSRFTMFFALARFFCTRNAANNDLLLSIHEVPNRALLAQTLFNNAAVEDAVSTFHGVLLKAVKQIGVLQPEAHWRLCTG